MKIQDNNISLKMSATGVPKQNNPVINEQIVTYQGQVDYEKNVINKPTLNGKELSPMQKHNKFVDKLKDEWCGMHCIPLLRIWEHDIRKNPKKVMDMICEYSSSAKKRKLIMDNKKRPH